MLVFQGCTPLKINMEHSDGGLEDHFPFEMGDGCRFQPLIFQGVDLKFTP